MSRKRPLSAADEVTRARNQFIADAHFADRNVREELQRTAPTCPRCGNATIVMQRRCSSAPIGAARRAAAWSVCGEAQTGTQRAHGRHNGHVGEGGAGRGARGSVNVRRGRGASCALFLRSRFDLARMHSQLSGRKMRRFILWVSAVGVVTAADAASGMSCPAFGMLECAGRGACEADGTCSCSVGFAGIDCAIVLRCDPEATRLPCSGRGRCNVQHGCECAPGYSGATCEVDDWCPLDKLGRKCSGSGVCSAHACLCPSHRSGLACEHGDTSSRVVPEIVEA